MEGGDLDDYLTENFEVISKDHVVEWLKQMVSALKYLHSKKAIHRDFKPGLDQFYLLNLVNFKN